MGNLPKETRRIPNVRSKRNAIFGQSITNMEMQTITQQSAAEPCSGTMSEKQSLLL